MKKFVWDSSAIINIKEPNAQGYSPGHSLIKDLSDGWIPGPYLNIFPALALFEVQAAVSRKLREGRSILREFYILNEHSIVYEVDLELARRSVDLCAASGFDRLHGADLVFACIAHLENATLVTKDRDLAKHVAGVVDILDLNESLIEPLYRDRLRT